MRKAKVTTGGKKVPKDSHKKKDIIKNKDQNVQKENEKNRAEKSDSQTVPVVNMFNMFKMMPQAKFKNANANKPSPLKKKITKISGIQIQANILHFVEKTEPKKFKVTGQQMKNDNPKPIVNLKPPKGQNPPIKKISQEKKEIQARGSTEIKKCAKNKNDKSGQKQPRDKKNTPVPKMTTHVNLQMFQKLNQQVLEVPMPAEEMPGTTPPSMTTQEAAITNTGAIRKKVTTIFVKKKVETKQKKTHKVATATTKTAICKKVVPTQAVEATTSDEELLEATLSIELEEVRKDKEKADSDEEFLQAAESFENLQILEAKVDNEQPEDEVEVPKLNLKVEQHGDHHHRSDHGDNPHQGDHHDHPHQEEGAKITRMTTFQKLSPRVTESQPAGNHEWKEGSQYLEGHEEGDLQAGGDHHHARDQGAEGADGAAQQGGARGVTRSTPPSPTSPTRSTTTPPGSPMTPRSSSTSGARLTCTPLWKKKSMERRMSSSQGKSKRSSKKKGPSQQRSPADTTASRTLLSASAPSTSTSKYQMSPTPEKARPGPELPRKSLNIEQTFHAQKQSANTSSNPTDVARILTNHGPGKKSMK
jgi:hypothetical protein